VQPDHERRAKAVLARLALFLAVGALYFAVGMAFLETRVFLDGSDLFDADIRRVVHDIARRNGVHYRTKVHPLFVLFFNPIGVFLKTWMVRPRPVAILLNAAAAALGVVLFRELLARLGVERRRGDLWTAVFALSTSQVFFGVFPETFAFSAASLLLVFVVFAGEPPARLRAFLSSLVAFGVTTVNLAACLFLSLLRQPAGTPPRKAVSRTTAFAVAVVATAVALSLVQKAYAPSTEVFFLPSSFAEETSYTFRPQSVGAVVARAGDLVRSVLFTSLAAPALAVQRPADLPPLTRFGGWNAVSAIHALVWLGLLVACAAAWRRLEWRRRPLVRALALWVAFNLALYSFYGTTFFLYSSQWTFAVLALTASALEALPDRQRRATAIALAALVSLQAWANGALLLELHRLYR
jgi:hypothetical protein